MSSISKSMFSNSLVPSKSRQLYNPVVLNSGSNGLTFSMSFLPTLKKIHEFYGLNMVNRTYYNIPNDYDEYVQLYVILQQIQSKTKNQNLLILLKLAEDTLVGAINSYTIYGENLVLNVDKINLQQKINDILSNKNERFVEIASATGQLSINKTFQLAPVFNYYIIIYGLPAYGVGFDPMKINYLVDVLQSYGINPFK